MIDPITAKILLSIAAGILLRDTIRTQSQSSERELQHAKSEAVRIQEQLSAEVQGMRVRQALDTLHNARRQYVSKSQQYYKLKSEYKERLDALYSDIRRINAMKAELYGGGHHNDIPVLKAKTAELYAVVKEVDAAFKEYGQRVMQYNDHVAKIKELISRYSDA